MSTFDKRQVMDRQVRREEDIQKGLTRTDRPSRGDFKICREADKVLKDIRKFRDPKDKAKIAQEHQQIQREYRLKDEKPMRFSEWERRKHGKA